MLEQDSNIDFVESMMQSFKSLESIFYEDKSLIRFDYAKKELIGKTI